MEENKPEKDEKIEEANEAQKVEEIVENHEENSNEIKKENTENNEEPKEEIASEIEQNNETLNSVEQPKQEEKIEEHKEEKVEKKDKFKAIKIIWKIIKAILTIALLLVFAVIAIQRISHNKVTVGGYGIYTIVSESMVPEYQLQDMLFAKKTDPADIEIGDDVVYLGEKDDFKDKIVTHRVIKKNYDGTQYTFITKGIANPIEDPAITGNQIYGKVVLKSTVLSTISKVINTTYGFYIVIFVPFVIIITLELIDTVNERKKLKRN